MHGGSAKRYFLGGLAIGVVAMSAAGLAAATLIETPAQVAAKAAAPPRSLLTSVVRWQVLRAAITTQGLIRPARTVSVRAAAPYATLTVTRMPVKAGDRVKPGQVIAEIDGRPILLLRGRLPAYRNLHEGNHGPDVTQLQAGLESLGYADFDERGDFGPSTALALELYYSHLGYTAPLYHPPRPKPGASTAARPAVADPPQPSPYLPKSEVTYIPAASALVVAVGARTGSLAGSAPVLTLATGNPYVTGVLSGHQASLVRVGLRAEIASASPPVAATGTVIRIDPVSGGQTAAGRYPVRLRLRKRLPQRLAGTRVRLTILAAVTAGPVLTVPAASVFAGSPGTAGSAQGTLSYVIVIGRDARRVRVPVTTGPSADGLVAVQAAGKRPLLAGARVLIGIGR